MKTHIHLIPLSAYTCCPRAGSFQTESRAWSLWPGACVGNALTSVCPWLLSSSQKSDANTNYDLRSGCSL